jgi:hypothetical protein
LPSEIILQRHRAQFRDYAVDLPVVQGPYFGRLVDGEAGHEFCADLRAYAVEGLQRSGDKAAFCEVGAEDEDLLVVSMLQ